MITLIISELLIIFIKKPEIAHNNLNKIISSVGKVIGWDGVSYSFIAVRNFNS